MTNGLHQDDTGFGTRSGLIYYNEGETPGWFYFIGSGAARGPFGTKGAAVTHRDQTLEDMDAPRRVTAPFMTRFNMDAEPDMFSDNLPDMLRHMADVMQRQDKRFRGYMECRNHAGLIVAKVNLLGEMQRERQAKPLGATENIGSIEPDPISPRNDDAALKRLELGLGIIIKMGGAEFYAVVDRIPPVAAGIKVRYWSRGRQEYSAPKTIFSRMFVRVATTEETGSDSPYRRPYSKEERTPR